MSNASTDVLRRGWELYRTTSPRPSLDDINALLVADGFDSVSERAHKHYRKLDRNGLVEYLPINELDTRLKLQRRNGNSQRSQSPTRIGTQVGRNSSISF